MARDLYFFFLIGDLKKQVSGLRAGVLFYLPSVV